MRRLGIWAKNVPDWTTIKFATAKIGAILVNNKYKLQTFRNWVSTKRCWYWHIVPGRWISRQRLCKYDFQPGSRTERLAARRIEFPEISWTEERCIYRAAETSRNVQYFWTNPVGKSCGWSWTGMCEGKSSVPWCNKYAIHIGYNRFSERSNAFAPQYFK